MEVKIAQIILEEEQDRNYRGQNFPKSYNDIETVSEESFRDLYKLKYVDLSHNRIKNINFLLSTNISFWQFVLNFNLIREVSQVDARKFQRKKCLKQVLLHPNPWWCSNWDSLRVLVDISHSDQVYVGTGRVPYCLVSNSVEDLDLETRKFYQILERKRHFSRYNDDESTRRRLFLRELVV
mgnify:CR=1 FL=1